MAAEQKVVTKYGTRGGAVVEVVEAQKADRFEWKCGGCGSTSIFPNSRHYVNGDAQTHADGCSALPLD